MSKLHQFEDGNIIIEAFDAVVRTNDTNKDDVCFFPSSKSNIFRR